MALTIKERWEKSALGFLIAAVLATAAVTYTFCSLFSTHNAQIKEGETNIRQINTEGQHKSAVERLERRIEYLEKELEAERAKTTSSTSKRKS